ncbi:hypothetical protein [Embleya sp. NPDC020630]|uniref:hypothetical protein n=1 Tax=Embleya sp. NPDC020630 TaxID=3363979 RepID=UPI0037A277E6
MNGDNGELGRSATDFRDSGEPKESTEPLRRHGDRSGGNTQSAHGGTPTGRTNGVKPPGTGRPTIGATNGVKPPTGSAVAGAVGPRQVRGEEGGR